MVSRPAVAAALLGRWLDSVCGSGIAWTLGLLAVGLTVGCVSAWRHVQREMRG
jgi:predicted F0F1-ATPase subunit